ncbi:MAG: DNA/RNA helicase domain-containing protein [Dehalococcoidia bacterium]
MQPVAATDEAGFPDGAFTLWHALHDPARAPINPAAWANGAYKPTPNIIEAAQSLYGQHDVRDIALAGSTNLHATVETVLGFIERCRHEQRRGIAFITGAPGAGKTLAGLEIAHAADIIGNSEGLGVFLSGNWPLVEVIKAAIAESAKASGRRTERNATREVSTLIEHAYRFRNEYAGKPDRIPHHHVVLFDEAQRAWDASQVARKERDPDAHSEPAILLDIMTRTPDWAVIVAMVGSGQEINTGESGLAEWGRALRDAPEDWLVLASPHVFDERTPASARLFTALPAAHPTVATEDQLHLQMNVRSPRAERLNQWVDHLLSGNPADARAALPDLREFPMAVTRSLDTAKQWLRDHCDPEEQQRMGLLASAGAKRLRAWGLETGTLRAEQNWAHWFLRPRGDVRSSNQLEVPATNFDCQGLEIDWAAVCWANDFVPDTATRDWRIRAFSGTRWSTVRKDPHFVVNGYRVILTRARRGQIIWVPRPQGDDATLPPADFDAIAAMLQSAGLPLID